jgi:hypothetical protein
MLMTCPDHLLWYMSPAGVPWDSDDVIQLVQEVLQCSDIRFRGLYSHCGHSYVSGGDVDQVTRTAWTVTDRLLKAKHRYVTLCLIIINILFTIVYMFTNCVCYVRAWMRVCISGEYVTRDIDRSLRDCSCYKNIFNNYTIPTVQVAGGRHHVCGGGDWFHPVLLQAGGQYGRINWVSPRKLYLLWLVCLYLAGLTEFHLGNYIFYG